jgi:EAL and modified HD-GYP domain-containing signal transduction protein
MNTSGQAPASTPSPCLARQPILTKDEQVEGYELLFRENQEDNRFNADFENATSSIIDTLNIMGLDAICDGRLGFINCTEQMLLKEFFLLLPPDRIVIEIQQNVPADEAVLGACQRLKHNSYSLALDNFGPHDPREALVPFVDFLKVDIRRFTSAQSKALCAQYAGKPVRLIAHKVETRLQMITAGKDGFTLFQGYFFRRPERMRTRHIPANQASYLRLLQVISAAEVDLAAVENLIKHDASLCYRLLRYLNSPLLGVSSPVHSIRHGITCWENANWCAGSAWPPPSPWDRTNVLTWSSPPWCARVSANRSPPNSSTARPISSSWACSRSWTPSSRSRWESSSRGSPSMPE